jgi:Protein of unknown function (DUF1501)
MALFEVTAMLVFHRSKGARYCDGMTRRELLRVGSLGWGGLTLPALLRLGEAVASEPRLRRAPRARSVIVLYLSGGPSQLDMWDMKPAAPEEIRGTFQPIMTSVPGIHVCEHMPRMARLADKYTIIRSMSHHEGDHVRAGYYAMTGGQLQRPVVQASAMSRDDRPHLGGALARFLERSSPLPPFVMVPEFVSPVGVPRPGQHGGFLGAEFDPYLVNSDPNLPSYSPGEMHLPADLSAARLRLRRSLLARLEDRGRSLAETPAGRNLAPYYSRAFDLIAAPAVERAFDISSEPESTRDRYGRTDFGQSTLLARRLIEAGVRLVQVNFVRHNEGKGGQGYDSHSTPPRPPHLTWAKNALLPPTDAAFAALVEDLSDRGLLDETLVIMLGEFGRTPRFNQYGGRDHWPQCYSAVLAGGGIRKGYVFGASDKIAATVVKDPVSPEDLLATVYDLVGIDPQTIIHDLQGRPFPLADARPVGGLLV